MVNSQKAVGLLGGSFDPIHNGHIAIVNSFLESEFISKLWILLTPEPPHKTEKVLTDYEHRLKMLQAAFRHRDNVEINDVEKELPRPSYTIQTLEHLAEEYTDINFYLCVGEDSISDFKEWKDWEKILDICEVLVARRTSNDITNLDPKIEDFVHFIDHNPVDISSTEIRRRVAEGSDISSMVPEQVKKIIKENNLYKKTN